MRRGPIRLRREQGRISRHLRGTPERGRETHPARLAHDAGDVANAAADGSHLQVLGHRVAHGQSGRRRHGDGRGGRVHSCTLPFVFEMSREGDRIVATHMDILARRVTHEFREADVKREPTTLRPFVTFEADGESFFVTKSGFADEADADLFGSNS